jgi:pimeloyl-ACP methyl ester carboxylesterase
MAGRTFVLVHGAWHGGWCWKRVATLLRAKDHHVYTPTLTGVADRSHLLSPDISLATQVDDIVQLMRWEELSDVVLVGHSSGGVIISGVAEKMENAIASLVFLDAFVPENGQSVVDIMANGESAERIHAAARDGAITLPPIPASVFKVNDADAAWVDRMCTPHPIRHFTDPLTLTGARERIPRRSYILATVNNGATFVPTHERLKNDPTWRTYEIPCGHDVMLDMPERLADVLEEA